MKENRSMIYRFIGLGILVLLLFGIKTNIQALSINQEWSQVYKSTGIVEDSLWAIIQTNDGGYIAVGRTEGDVGGGSPNQTDDLDGWIIKVDKNGNQEWSKQYDSIAPSNSNNNDGTDDFYSIIQTSDGGYLVAGHGYDQTFVQPSDPTQIGEQQAWLVKIDADGNKQWLVYYGAGDYLYDCFYSVIETSDGGFLAAGETYGDATGVGSNLGGGDGYLVKVDSTGNLVWSKQYGGSDDDRFNQIIATSDGNYVIAGTTYGSVGGNSNLGSGYDGWLLKIDPNGNELWSKQYGSNTWDQLQAVREGKDGSYTAVGYTYGTVTGSSNLSGIGYGYDGWVLNVNPSTGATNWTKQYGTSSSDVLNSIYQTADGGWIAVGNTTGSVGDGSDSDTTNLGIQDGYFLRLDKDGNKLWERQYGAAGYDSLLSVIQDDEGYYVAAGFTNGISGADSFANGWIIKIAEIYQLSFNSNGGTGSMAAKEIKYNETISLPNNSFTKTDYVFKGWATSQAAANNGEVTYQDGGSYQHNISDNRVLYAVWTKETQTTYTVKYDGNTNTGGIAPVDSQEYLSGAKAKVLKVGTLVKKGYKFISWNTKADGSGAKYFPGATITISDNIILYAQWELIQQEIQPKPQPPKPKPNPVVPDTGSDVLVIVIVIGSLGTGISLISRRKYQ